MLTRNFISLGFADAQPNLHGGTAKHGVRSGIE